jgi:tRNA(Ile)-lysidine synthase TilS/MesJ
LPETFPGISINAEGICSLCQRFAEGHSLAHQKEIYEAKFTALLEKHRRKAGHDLIMAYSGGKDSTYTLDIFVKRYKLRVLALTFDNSFIPLRCFENTRRVCHALGVDHYLVRPNPTMLHAIFRTAARQELFSPKALERASTICTCCIGLVKSIVLRTAIEKGIPFVGYGWSPGQAPLESSVMKTNPLFARSTQGTLLGPLHRIAGDAIAPYFLGEEHFQQAERFPWNIHPLAFLDYDEERILRRDRELGWEKPEETDANSTNCLLNALANQIHKERYNFHPYAWELANMVRCGSMTRDQALAKIDEPERQDIVLMAKRRLEL